jgi:acetyl esterase/lipase
VSVGLDAEYLTALMQTFESMQDIVLPEPGDAVGLRALVDSSLIPAFGQLPASPEIVVEDEEVSAYHDAEISLRWYSKPAADVQSCVVYVHGGGMICGSVEIYDRLVRYYVAQTGVAFASVEYRLAPEVRGPALTLDVVAGVKHVLARGPSRGIDTGRVAVMGDSGGGGLAAAAAIVVRDEGMELAKQILVFPMLDDRTVVPDPGLAATATWTYVNNETCWRAVLGDNYGAGDTSPYTAPARLTDFTGLTPAYIEVGELDIFRDECVAYAANLTRAGTSCELHVHPCAPHGYDWLAPGARVTKRALHERLRVISEL